MPFKKPHQTSTDSAITGDKTSKYEIKPKGLNIVWGSDPRYWDIRDDVAELKQVCWLEVSGKVAVERSSKYKVKFVVDLKDDGFGWNSTEVLVMAKIGKKGKYEFKPVTLTAGTNLSIPNEEDLVVEVKPDVKDHDLELHFGLYEVWSGKWKGGLLIKKAEVIKQ